MAVHKRNRSRKERTRQFLRFPEVKGKIVEAVEIDPDINAIMVLFQDNTALSFDLEPCLTLFPELSNRKSGNWRSLKRWRPLHSKINMVKW